MFKITYKDLTKELTDEEIALPKYASSIINRANFFAGGTRPQIVGQMTELIQQAKPKSYKEWEKWYLERHPDSIDKAVDMIALTLNDFKKSISSIDKSMIRRWVKDLVIVKTFVGLRFQEAVLKIVAKKLGKSYSLSTSREESKGIDGFIGDKPVSIKPKTYKSESDLAENIEIPIIFYEKKKGYILVDDSNFTILFGTQRHL